MGLIIDGYNLLHVTGIFGRGSGPGAFQRTREALLSFLASSLSERDRKQAVIVFDAADAPPGLPRTVFYQGIKVRYASEYPDADTLIERLVQQHSAPRSLLVVSSDHRVQRAARRRKARIVDSEEWYSDLWQRRNKRQLKAGGGQLDKPPMSMSPSEIDYWVAQFSAGLEEHEISPPERSSNDNGGTLENPFPPGYGEDVSEEDDQGSGPRR